MAEPLGDRARGERGELAQRADAEPLEDLRQGLELGPRAEQGDRQRSEEVADAASSTTTARVALRMSPPRRGTPAAPRRAPRSGSGPRRSGLPGRAPGGPRRGRRRGRRRGGRGGRRPRRRPRPRGPTPPAAPIPSSLSSTAPQSERTPSGSGATSRSPGQRDIASPSRMPRTIPYASAGAETSPTTCSRPASGASAAGSESSARRSPSAAKQLEPGVEDADDHVEHMFALVPAACKTGLRYLLLAGVAHVRHRAAVHDHLAARLEPAARVRCRSASTPPSRPSRSADPATGTSPCRRTSRRACS